MSADVHLTTWALLSAAGGWLQARWGDGRLAVARRSEEPGLWLELLRREGAADLFVGPARQSRTSSVSLPVGFLAVLSSSKASERILGRFHPEPTLVLREGRTARLTCLWGLVGPLGVSWAREANRRLAHRAQAPKKLADPDELLFRPAGSLVRQKRGAIPVLVEFHDPTALYRPRDVVGRLPQSPNPDAWREKAA